MRGGAWSRAAAWLVAMVVMCSVVEAAPGPIDALGADDVGEVETAIAAIEGRSKADTDPDLLFAAARACEDKLLDPGRAAVIYRRLVTDHPDARVANAAARRLKDIGPMIGQRDEAAGKAAALARLIAKADDDTAVNVYERAAALSNAAWPGAPSAGRWLADWLRRREQPLAAMAQYLRVVARWPTSGEAAIAARGAVGAALDAHAWTLADALIDRLPTEEAADRAIGDDLRKHARRGRWRDRGYVAAWLIVGLALLGFAAELGWALARTARGQRRRALRPPGEIMFLAPVSAVLIGVAITANRQIAPAVATISIGGLVLAWLSGAALEQRRRLGQRQIARSLAHIALCGLAVIALVYIALTRDALIDALIETVRFGPDA